MSLDGTIKANVLAYFSAKGAVPGESDEQKLSFDYLKAGFIDSMGIVEMIGTFEEKFDVRFEQEHFDSPGFSTIGGLVDIISSLKGS
ncbi:MAG: acyl carrier protein [Chitinispirillaceae bacterium]|nr:acyl carrier protein [Chitinispirillaceae bacterium]